MKNYYVKALEHISYRYQNSEGAMLKQFITIMGEKQFNDTFHGYFATMQCEFDQCFILFHKSMRQTDFYDHDYEHSCELDLLFWDFIQISEVPYKLLKRLYNYDWDFFEESI